MHNTRPASPNWKPPFFTLWASQAASLFGSALVQFALVWWLTATTHSATVLAMAALAAILPRIIVGPIAGVLVDRWNRRVVMAVADGIVALATLGLAFLFASGLVQVWHVYAILIIRATAGNFQLPAIQASTSLMVPQEHLSRVAGFNQGLDGGMNIVAPPIGALLLGVLPLQGVLAIDVATAVLGIVPLFFVAIPQPTRAPAATAETGKPSFGRELREGLAYLWAWPGLLALLLMASVINFLLNPASSLAPILVTGHFGGGVLQLAWLDSTFGIGMVVGGITLGVWGGFRRRILTSLMGLVGLGLGFLFIGLAPATAFRLALASAFLAAVMIPITNGPIMAVMQSVVAPEMQGRLFSLVSGVAGAMSPLGLLIAGPVADAVGVQAWYILAGSACVAMGLAAFFIPAITHLEDNRTAPAESASQSPVVSGYPAST